LVTVVNVDNDGHDVARPYTEVILLDG